MDDTDKLALVLSDPQSMRFYPHPFSREEVENWIKWNIDNYKKYDWVKEANIRNKNKAGDCGTVEPGIYNGKLMASTPSFLDIIYIEGTFEGTDVYTDS